VSILNFPPNPRTLRVNISTSVSDSNFYQN